MTIPEGSGDEQDHDQDQGNRYSRNCTRQNNVVFIKTHKTGSTSLSHVVNRYGFIHNLSFVFNRLSPSNGHLVYLPLTGDSPRTHFLPPVGVRPGDYSKYKYNMLAVHVRYNRKAMNSFMKPNTHYVTIIRDPGTQFESAFTHFQLDDSFPLDEKKRFTTMQTRLAQFFTKPDYYRRRLKLMKWENKMGLRWYYAKNNQIFDLGLDHVYHNDKGKVQEYVNKLDREFRLVLITEYFDESLVLMKRLLCWDLEEVIYVAKNVRPNPANIPGSLRDKIRKWNDVDMKLYDHFNRTLWQRIKEYGPSFQQDLAEFRRRLKETFDSCVGQTEVKAQGHYFHWIEYKPRQDSSKLCAQIVESKKALFAAIWRRQEIKKPSGSSVFQAGRMNWRRYPPVAWNRPKQPVPRKPPSKPAIKPASLPKTAAKKLPESGLVSAPRPASSNVLRPPPPKPVISKTVIKHVSDNGQSKSQPGDRNGDESSSVIIVHDDVKSHKPSINKTIQTNGTRVQPIMTYKKNT